MVSNKNLLFQGSIFRGELLLSGRVIWSLPETAESFFDQPIYSRWFIIAKVIHWVATTVDGRNPQQPPGMHKTLKIMGYLPYQPVSRISSINSSEHDPWAHEASTHELSRLFGGFNAAFPPINALNQGAVGCSTQVHQEETSSKLCEVNVFHQLSTEATVFFGKDLWKSYPPGNVVSPKKNTKKAVSGWQY